MKVKDLVRQHPDGSYEFKQMVTVSGAGGLVTLGPGVRFRAGVKFMGVDIAELLEQEAFQK